MTLVSFANGFLIMTEIVLFCTRRLAPLAYLNIQIAKSVLCIFILVYSSVVVASYHIDAADLSNANTQIIWSMVLISLMM